MTRFGTVDNPTTAVAAPTRMKKENISRPNSKGIISLFGFMYKDDITTQYFDNNHSYIKDDQKNK